MSTPRETSIEVRPWCDELSGRHFRGCSAVGCGIGFSGVGVDIHDRATCSKAAADGVVLTEDGGQSLGTGGNVGVAIQEGTMQKLVVQLCDSVHVQLFVDVEYLQQSLVQSPYAFQENHS